MWHKVELGVDCHIDKIVVLKCNIRNGAAVAMCSLRLEKYKLHLLSTYLSIDMLFAVHRCYKYVPTHFS